MLQQAARRVLQVARRAHDREPTHFLHLHRWRDGATAAAAAVAAAAAAAAAATVVAVAVLLIVVAGRVGGAGVIFPSND